MKISDFDYGCVDREKGTHYSGVHGKEFPILVPTSPTVQLEPATKGEIRAYMNTLLQKIPGESLNIGYKEDDQFNQDPNSNQFYRIASMLEHNPRNILSLVFRNSHQDSSVDGYLGNLHESSILRKIADCSSLDNQRKRMFKRDFRKALDASNELIGLEGYREFPVRMVQKRLQEGLRVYFDFLGIEKRRGNDPFEVLEVLSDLTVYPMIEKDDPLLGKVRGVFD